MGRLLQFASVTPRRFVDTAPAVPSRRAQMLALINDIQIISGFERSTAFETVAQLAHLFAQEARARAIGP